MTKGSPHRRLLTRPHERRALHRALRGEHRQPLRAWDGRKRACAYRCLLTREGGMHADWMPAPAQLWKR